MNLATLNLSDLGSMGGVSLPPRSAFTFTGDMKPIAPRGLRDVIPAGKGRITEAEMLDRIRKGQQRGMKSMLRLVGRHPRAVFCVVGGGPSLQDNVGELRRLAKRGAIIVAVNKSHDWLLKRGLPCHYGVLLDPKEWVADYITFNIPRVKARAGKLWVEPSYLIASQCHDVTLDKFQNHPRAYMWHGGGGIGEEKILRDEFGKGEWLNLIGASVVGLRAVTLAVALGASEVHLFGIDGSMKKPPAPAAREIYKALVDADMAKPGEPGYDEIMDMLLELARRRVILPPSVSAALKKCHYAYDKPNIDETWCGFTVELTSGWSRNFMANHHMSRSTYEFDDCMKHWDSEIKRGSLPPFNIRVHGDPEVSAIAMIAAGMGVHADPEVNEKYGQPPQRRAA